ELEQTDVFVTSDHGFSTISRRELDAGGARFTESFSSKQNYADVPKGFVPPGFLAIDLARQLAAEPTKGAAGAWALFDPDALTTGGDYKEIAVGVPGTARHPAKGNGILARVQHPGSPWTQDGLELVVCANGGSDLVYLVGEKSSDSTKASDEAIDFV